MHILLIHQAFAALDEAGGTRHIEMARYLTGRGHRVTIIASPVSYLSGAARGGRDEVSPGITVLRTYTYAALHRSFVHRVFAFLSFMVSSFFAGLRVGPVDLVWGTSPPIFQAVTAWLLARIKRAPYLLEVRDLWPAFAIAVGVLRNPLLIRLSQGLERFLYRRADRVVVNSPGFIRHVVDRGAAWVELIPNGADPAMFDPDCRGEAFRQANGLDGKFVVLYAGAHGLSNDLGVVLSAAERLRQRRDIHFVLVGDGKDKPALMAEAERKQLENVGFVSSVPKAEMRSVLAAADACVAILKPLEMYRTTYPNKVFDYMAAGRPVILAIDGVIAEVVERAGAGIPVRPGDPEQMAVAVERLAGHRDEARAMGLAGRAAVEQQYNRAQQAEKMALLMEELWRNGG
ncbi:MAG TPA: glycosyltransferase family 4 protein [Anaerolineaceae bacterium]|nr:glycosyltransferase family 4 protein [Anaerolineaceae bacterium]